MKSTLERRVVEDIRINDLNGFITLIDNLYKKLHVNALYDEDILFFRGQKNSNFSLLPSIARPTGSRELILQEYRMVNEFLYRKPKEFEGMKSSFNILAKMQHYGLPTRLLDITKNPLVALYFASETTKEKGRYQDGEVFFFESSSRDIKYSSSIDAILLSSYYKSPLHDFSTIADMIFDDERIEKLITEYGMKDKSLEFLAKRMKDWAIVLPDYYDDRQIRQSSAFIIFPNILSRAKWHDEITYGVEPEIADIKNTICENMMCRILIDAKSKERIRAQLSRININEEFLFPDMDSVADNIRRTAERIKDQFNKEWDEETKNFTPDDDNWFK